MKRTKAQIARGAIEPSPEQMLSFDTKKAQAQFAAAVNMTPKELEDWLTTEPSRSVGWRGTDGNARESVGHASGRRIVQILRKRKDELTKEDFVQMRRTVGFIRRHSAQRPSNIYTSRWRYSLMNWGHDPLKADED